MAPTLDSFKEAQYSPTREPQRDEEETSPRMVSCDAIKNEFLCAICLGLLKKTVTSQECLHRFCQNCIRTSLQVGNQECPTCRAKLTEANLRADPVFDNLIEKLFLPTESHYSKKQNILAEAPGCHEKSQQEKVSKNRVLAKQPNTVPEDGHKKGLVSHSGADGSGKRKRKSYKKSIGSAVKGCSDSVEKLHNKDSNIESKGTKPKTKLNNPKVPKQNLSLAPKRRSLRLENVKLESEKNKTEIEYNRRLSDGGAQIFFSSLKLKPSNTKNMESDSFYYNKKEVCSGKEECENKTSKLMDDVITARSKEDTSKAEEIQTLVSPKDRNTHYVDTISDIPVNSQQDDKKIGENEHLGTSTECSNVSNDINLPDETVSLKVMNSTDRNKVAKTPKKKEKQKIPLIPLRRSKRLSVIARGKTPGI